MGLIYKLFKPSIAGPDLINSLLILFNKIKNDLIIPDFMKTATITSFYKGRGMKGDMSSQRGVFCVSKIRALLDKLLYADYYDFADENLTDSNVGWRKN